MKLSVPVILTALSLTSGSALAVPMGPFQANDTGGIIAYTPDAYHSRHAIAGEYCSSWGKLHRITSVRRRYGEYIVFACYRPRNSEGIVLRSSY
ncbi:hypothetical protein GJW-30_1_03418 [Variibacter gotjawalensis]|jgi:hypothetical protein|uniref:Uncharacterized protein n=1 Tax=Variibacter gotjawalensis TaxID=1333996 RepID=A0A0S3PYA8_9BRAD|nr:hypothetical protein [Variibacter gotjawalensis]NIK46703.1 hypothetical protein [Variibacter gotjawalensis]RZS48606.1 hypothetical protein EV661_1021 [Variibacter gotjawalensis]BAT60868.1 hypothetical protein GJW-30_1_03418 [Variibacter gotjawalensis]